MSSSPGWKTFDFFTTSSCRLADGAILPEARGHGNIYTASSSSSALGGEKNGHVDDECVSAVERVVDGKGGVLEAAEKGGFKETFWVGTRHGMVHCLEVGYTGHVSCRCVKSFPALDGLCVGYLERVCPKNTDRTLLVVVGYNVETYSVVLTCWDVSDEDSVEVLPKRVASVSVFKSIKLPDSRLTCMDVDCTAWPRVTVSIGTVSGGVYMYACADVVGARKALFLPLPYIHVDVLKKAGGRVMQVHMYSSIVYAVGKQGMVGFDGVEGTVLVEDRVGAEKHCSCVNQRGELAVCSDDGIFYYTIEDGRTVAVSMKGEKRAMEACGEYMAIISPVEGSPDGECITLVHVEQKIVASRMTLAAPVKILHFKQCDTIVVYVLDGTGTLHILSEVSVRKQVDELCRHNLFQQALAMCPRALERDQEDLRARVNLEYGDYSFDRRDFDSATDAYINTIGMIETSHAIQKLLGAQQISHLCMYLRALLEKQYITGDHISLLIHSYVKEHAIGELDSLVEDLCMNKVDCEFDTEAAIHVLRQTGFIQHALDIARSYEKDDMYVSILLRERQAYKDVLEYLGSRPRAVAAEELKKNGKILLQNEPVSTTALLMELCIAPSEVSGDAFIADLADFAQIYIDNPQDLRYACEAILAMGAPNSPSRKRLYHTLLDMYLIKIEDTGSTDMHSEAAMDLLNRGWTPGHEPWYDADDALTSCRLHGFDQGIIFINKMLGRYRDAISTMTRVHDWQGIVHVCLTHGDHSDGGDPMVWHDALASLSCPDALSESEECLRRILDEIDEHNIVPPLTVLGILAKNPDVEFRVVKDYFGRIFESEYESIKDYSQEIEELNKSIEMQQNLLDKVESKPRVFQATKDSQTGAPLELPLVHFMCGHSFNLRTLSDQDDPKCPLCSAEHQRIEAMQRSFKAAAEDRDSFFRQLHSSDDAFSFIAEAFGKGYMNTSSRQWHPS
jgi:vacuolar protein sorting-associated protein 11